MAWPPWWASVTGVIATQVLLVFTDSRTLTMVAITLLSGWIAFTLTHALTTWRAHHGRRGAALRAALDADAAPQQRSLAMKVLLGAGAHSFALSVAMLSLIGVMALVVSPELRRETAVLGLGAALVAVAWCDVVITYAVHYARLDHTEGGLRFPTDETREPELSFGDYHYFSTGVQTTFGTTDVSVTSSLMRHTVRQHGTLAFVFNSVVVALIVSLALTLAPG